MNRQPRKDSNNVLLAEGLGDSASPSPMFSKNFKLSGQAKKFRLPGKSDFFFSLHHSIRK